MSAFCEDGQLDRERAYYEDLYREFAAEHFAKPAVVSFRHHLVRRLLAAAQLGPSSHVLSIGCGVGDTELLIAAQVASITGIDLSETAIQHARSAAACQRITNAEFFEGTWQRFDTNDGQYDAVLAIFFLHHLPDQELDAMPERMRRLLRPGGVFYALEPSARRLSGAIGELLFPQLMRKYQAPDERQLDPGAMADRWRRAGFHAGSRWYDFTSTPLAGLFPAWRVGYQIARRADDVLVRIPGVRQLSSNFELIATA